jgi:hypothetical protein
MRIVLQGNDGFFASSNASHFEVWMNFIQMFVFVVRSL